MGAIQQLVFANYGVDNKIQDTFLTGKPSHNFIKQVYRQYINFAIENIKILPVSDYNFNKKITFEIKKTGEFLKSISFAFTLPPLVPSSGTFAGWTNGIGYAIIDYIEIQINNKIIDTQYGLFMMIWYELTNNLGYTNASDSLIGKFSSISSLQYNALYPTTYHVEIPFWFSENIGSALPLLCLTQSSFIIFNVKLNSFDKCIVYDGVTPPNQVSLTDCWMDTDQIFVDDQFVKKFKGEKHTYIIKQCQIQKDDIIGKSKKLELNFNHPVNQLLFVARESESEENNDWFNFGLRNNGIVHQPVYPLLVKARLLLDSKERNEYQSSNELSLLNSHKYYINTVDTYIYSMPFCNEPTKWFPNGSLNFSIIDSAELQLEFIDQVPDSSLIVFAINFNFIEIDGNYVKLEYDT